MKVESIGRVYELIDELTEEIYKAFPDGTRFSLTSDKDGYATFNIMEWGESGLGGINNQKRREVFAQSRVHGEWGADTSASQNEYLWALGILLEKEEEE